MEIKRNSSFPRRGMNRNSHPTELKAEEYSFALNTNIQNENGDGPLILQNESSNIKCSNFKEGYVVIGHKFDVNADRTYFFLANPTTGNSEIGYIDSIRDVSSKEAVEIQCGCDIKVSVEDPLEDTAQEGYCTYVTLMSDFCEEEPELKCLKFSIDHPIHERNIEIKDEVSGKRLYFTDNYNPPRTVRLDNIDSYYKEKIGCEDPIESCLDCEKLRVFPLYNKPCLTPTAISAGGNLRSGIYEFTLAYCDEEGKEISNYFSHTNPLQLFNLTDNYRNQTDLDYNTQNAIQLEVSDLDESFNFFRVAILYKSGLDESAVVKVTDKFPISTKRVTISTTNNIDEITLQEVLGKRPFYKKSKGLTAANGHLFHFGLETQREVNLQPVVNLMGGFIKWGTSIASEKLYKQGVATSNYVSYMRDEAYPLSIKFFMDGGQETSNFTFIPRPPTEEELEDFVDEGGNVIGSNLNVESILEYNAECLKTDRRKRWQFENTANIDPEPCPSKIPTVPVVRDEEFTCTVSEDGTPVTVDSIASGTLIIEDADDLVRYINDNKEEILASTDPQWDAVKAILTNNYEAQVCEPELLASCTELILKTDGINIIALDTSDVSIDLIPFEYSDYERELPPSSCNHLVKTFTEDGEQVKLDTDFSTTYIGPFPDFVVGEKTAVNNDDCNLAQGILSFSGDNPSVGYHLVDKGAKVDSSLLQTDKNSLVGAVGTNTFTNKLHTNAIWLKGNFSGRESVVLEMSRLVGEKPDSNTTYSVRITVYNNCNTTAYVKSQIIPDIRVTNINMFLEVFAEDFTDDDFYVAIDSGIIDRGTVDTEQSYTLGSTPGCFSFTQRDPLNFSEIDFTNLTFGKRMTYETTCTYILPDPKEVEECDPSPYQKGEFSYMESEIKYPCNKELWDSSELDISASDIPESIRPKFEEYYVDSISGGDYTLNQGTNYQDKPIRHYKFPDNKVAPFMSTNLQAPEPFNDSVIYPIGFIIDNEVVSSFLDIAVKNNLISLEERNKIKKYEIFRGDRRVEKTVVAKGILFDMYKYNENNSNLSEEVKYSNYPLNTLGRDQFNQVNHPMFNVGNTDFTFHSPDTHFDNPTIPPEISIDGYLFGKSKNRFDEVLDHPRYVLLGDRAFRLATTLAIAEVAFETYIQTFDWLVEANSTHWSGLVSGNIIAGLGVVGLILQGVFQVGSKRQQWIEIFRGVGKPEQFAYYQATVGHYNNFLPNSIDASRYRAIPVSNYIRDGRWNVNSGLGTQISINNEDRENSLYLSTGFENKYKVSYPEVYRNWDNQSNNPAQATRHSYKGVGKSGIYEKNTAVPYVTLKRYLPTQYGSINSINWVSTNHCGDLREDNECNIAYGGDVFISRFAVKRKFPFFRVNSFGLANNTPFRYSDYFNINAPDPAILEPPSNRFYINYKINQVGNISGFLFPSDRSEYVLDVSQGRTFYERPPSKFYLFSYGFPYFLVESEYNCNLRHAGTQRFQDFYPNNEDVIQLTQERIVPIREPERFLFNSVFLNRGTGSAWWTLPDTYQRILFDKIANLGNSVIYSRKDASETDVSDPWVHYRPLDFYNFPTSFGELVSLDALESEQILARFKNGFSIFGSVDKLADRITPESFFTGQGGIFAGRELNFNKTELGYAGTQHTAMVSCNFGHFWVDAKRGQVIALPPGAQGGINEISISNDKWFKEQLPFKILSVEGMTELDVDNSYKGLGISMGWDERLKRVFITKLDYTPKSKDIVYINNKFFIDEVEVQLDNKEYFENCSWTIAYSPLVESWVSYYSFKPNFYVAYNDYFQTAVLNGGEYSIWSHLPFISSNQVFYGERYPFKVEYPLTVQGGNSVLHDVNYFLDTKKYYNKYDSADVYGVGFNKAVIYNNSQNSGLLELVHQKKNDLSQQLDFPKHKKESTEILQSEINDKWAFNSFYNLVRNEQSGLPLWLSDCANVDKEINSKLLNFLPGFSDRIRGEYFLIRLIQDKESRYKMIFRLATDKREFYE